MQLRTAFPTAVALGCICGAVLAKAGSTALQSSSPASGSSAVTTALQPAQQLIRWDLPVVWNESVAKFVDLFETEQTDRMALYLKRSGRYEGMIRSKLRARGMPEDLVYLSMIESGFNPNARSRASAVGLWQFMAPTARDYGLRVDSYVDERRDPEKSTDAALRYLQDLHNEFGAWNLAAAAYNTGDVRVARAMRAETGAVKGEESDFWRIRDRLPRDTREYVPLMFAMAMIGKQPAKYGLDHVERWLPLRTDTVPVPGGMELERVAKAVGVDEADLRTLNPHLVKGVTPPNDRLYPVRIPDGRIEAYASEFAALQREARAPRATEKKAEAKTRKAKASPVRSTPSRYRVRKGESLWTIARRHGVSVQQLRSANGLSRRAVLRPGQRLRIPA